MIAASHRQAQAEWHWHCDAAGRVGSRRRVADRVCRSAVTVSRRVTVTVRRSVTVTVTVTARVHNPPAGVTGTVTVTVARPGFRSFKLCNRRASDNGRGIRRRPASDSESQCPPGPSARESLLSLP
eukprot:32378-Rhodomonas_salina.3